MAPQNKNTVTQSVKRIRLWYGLLILVLGIVGVRLFYLQVIRHDHYRAAALSDQLKQYEIPATRGIIKAYDGKNELPIVLNQKLYIVFADPVNIKDAEKAAAKVVGVVGGDAGKYERLMKTKKSRYVVLAKKVPADLAKRAYEMKVPGVGIVAQDYRTYPQNTLLAQTLGFVDDEGQGKYGIEQTLNKKLTGIPGELKAITDASGVPLAASRDNTRVAPKDGQDVTLTIDLALQQQLETILAEGVKKARAPSGHALIMDPKTGAIKAMANVPTYDPAKYFEVEDGSLFQNGTVTHSIEVGSTLKTLTTAAALDSGSITANQTYYDPASWVIDEFRVTNIEEDGGAATRSVSDILNYSLNTGVTWQLMQMGGGQINQKARETWHRYLTDHFRFGKPTGIEQGYESEGYVPGPENTGSGINLTYANMSFGQAMTATPIQLGAALSSVLNGGTYYQPYLVDKTTDYTGKSTKTKPKAVKTGVVRQQTTNELIPMMQNVINKRNLRPAFDQNVYMVGGKTGTAQIADPAGGYYGDQFNGTYVGFVGGAQPDYVIVVFVNKPKIGGYAGSASAQPIFVDLARMMINNSYVTPRQ